MTVDPSKLPEFRPNDSILVLRLDQDGKLKITTKHLFDETMAPEIKQILFSIIQGAATVIVNQVEDCLAIGNQILQNPPPDSPMLRNKTPIVAGTYAIN